jgi:hypothetical protein
MVENNDKKKSMILLLRDGCSLEYTTEAPPWRFDDHIDIIILLIMYIESWELGRDIRPRCRPLL